MVRVVGAERFLDASALEASLGVRREFTAPGPRGEHCYHAVRLVLRICLMHGKEAFCERAGSIVHQLWDAQSHWHAGRIGDRLQMRMIGLGEHSPLRESVVREITDYIWDQGKNPVVRYGKNRGKPGPGEIWEESLGLEVALLGSWPPNIFPNRTFNAVAIGIR